MVRLLLVTLLAVFSFRALSEQSLIVRSHTVVQTSNDIFLSDIIDNEGLSEKVIASMKKVKLAKGPKIGERQVLSSESISRLIRRYLTKLNLPEKMKLTIPRQVIVENKGYTVSAMEVENQLKHHWQTFCKSCEFQITQLMLPKINQSQVAIEWSILFDSRPPRGQFSYQIKGSQGSLGWIQGLVKVFDQVPVVTRAINFGEKLDKSDFQFSKKEVTYSNDSPAAKNALIGRRLKRALRSGDIVWTNSLEKRLAARRGDPIKMIIGSADWQLSVPGIAQMDGQIGDTISVKNPKSNKIVSGVLKKEREVHVQ